MPANKAVWAIDIGQCALKAIHARLVGEEIEIDQYVVLPHEQILSQPDADEPDQIRKTLKKFSTQFPVIKDSIIISVPGHRSFARFSKLPPVEPKKIPDIVHYEATQQIPFGIDEVVWDYHTFQAQGTPDVEVGIFAIKRSIISQYLAYFHELNLRPAVVQTAPIALYNACTFEGLLGKEAVVLADVGAQNTNFLVAEDYRLWLRNIPLGGNNFTEALQKSFKLNFGKAEELKCSAATSKYARAVFQSMRPIFSDLSGEFQRSIGFYTSVNRESQVKELYSMGSAFRLPGLLKFLQQNLNLNVKKLETFGKARLAGGINEADFSENVLTLAVAYGLVVQGLGLAKVITDLMPPEVSRQVAWKRKEYWFIGAAACLLIAALGVQLRVSSDLSKAEADKEQYVREAKPTVDRYTKFMSDYESLKSGNQTQGDAAGDLEKMNKNQVILPKIMAVLTESLPKPQKELADAQDLAQYQKAAKAVPRAERKQVFISNLVLKYIPDLTEKAIADMEQSARTNSGLSVSRTRTPGMGGMGGMDMPYGSGGPGGMGMPGMGGPEMGGMPGMRPGMGQPGGSLGNIQGRRQGSGTQGPTEGEGRKAFILTIEGTTPHAGAPEFLTSTLVKNLQTYGKERAIRDKLPFWIDHVNPVSFQPLVSKELLERAEKATDKDKDREKDLIPKDPLTQESLKDDSIFLVTCVVNLGSPEKKADVGMDRVR